MSIITELLQRQFASIHKVVKVCVISVLIAMALLFNDYYQVKFAIRTTIIHLVGIIITSLLLKQYLLLKIKSFFWKVDGVILVYFMSYFFINQGIVFIERGRFLRAGRTEYLEINTFILTLVISSIIAIIMKIKKLG